MVVVTSVWFSEACALTEPSAVAPDAKLNSEYSVNPSNYHHTNLSLASGATALGSVKSRHLSQVQTDPPPAKYVA